MARKRKTYEMLGILTLLMDSHSKIGIIWKCFLPFLYFISMLLYPVAVLQVCEENSFLIPIGYLAQTLLEKLFKINYFYCTLIIQAVHLIPIALTIVLLCLLRGKEPVCKNVKTKKIKIISTSIIMLTDLLNAAFGIFFCEIIIPLKGKRMDLVTMEYYQIFENRASYIICCITAMLIYIGFLSLVIAVPILGGIFSKNQHDRWCSIGRILFMVINDVAYVVDPAVNIYWLNVVPQLLILFALVVTQYITKPSLDMQMCLYIGSDMFFFHFYIFLVVKYYIKASMTATMLISLIPAMLINLLLIMILNRKSKIRCIGHVPMLTNRELLYTLYKAINDKSNFDYQLYIYMLTLDKHNLIQHSTGYASVFPTAYIEMYYNLATHSNITAFDFTSRASQSDFKAQISLSLMTIILTGNICKALCMLKNVIGNSKSILHKIEAYSIIYKIGSQILDSYYYRDKSRSVDFLCEFKYSRTLEKFVRCSSQVNSIYKQLILMIKRSLNYKTTLLQVKKLYIYYSKLHFILSELRKYGNKGIVLHAHRFIDNLSFAIPQNEKPDNTSYEFISQLPLIIECSLFGKLRIKSISKYCISQLGYRKEDLVNQSLAVLMPPQIREAHEKIIPEILGTRIQLGRIPNRVVILAKNGYIRYYKMTVSILPVLTGPSLHCIITLSFPDAEQAPKYVMGLHTNFVISHFSQECDCNAFEEIIKDETKLESIIGDKYEIKRNIGNKLALRENLRGYTLQIQSIIISGHLLGYLAMFYSNANEEIMRKCSSTKSKNTNAQNVTFEKLNKTVDMASIGKLLIILLIVAMLSLVSVNQSHENSTTQKLSQFYFIKYKIISLQLSALYFDKVKNTSDYSRYLDLVYQLNCEAMLLYTNYKFQTSDSIIESLITHSIYICAIKESTIFQNNSLFSADAIYIYNYMSQAVDQVIAGAQNDTIQLQIQKIGFVWPLSIVLICFIIMGLIDIGTIRKYSFQINKTISKINQTNAISSLQTTGSPDMKLNEFHAIKERALLALFIAISLTVIISILPIKYSSIKQSVINYKCLFQSIKQTIISNYIILNGRASLINEFNVNEIDLHDTLQKSTLHMTKALYQTLYTTPINSSYSGLIECVGSYSDMSYKFAYSNLMYTLRTHNVVDKCYAEYILLAMGSHNISESIYNEIEQIRSTQSITMYAIVFAFALLCLLISLTKDHQLISNIKQQLHTLKWLLRTWANI